MIGAPTYLEVTTLGRFEVRRDQELLAGGNWNRRKVNELFKLLLTSEQHRLHREQIQEILWSSFTSEQAANSFGKTLYLLRRALEPALAPGRSNPSTYVALDHDTLMLVADNVRVDADSFEASIKQLQVKARSHAAKSGSVRETAALLDEFDQTLAFYGGDYLPEDLYEDWTQRRRDRLRRFYSWLLENAADVAISSGLGLRACEYLQALLERNPADEQTHRRLMVVYARMGRRSDALNQYQFLREALREELRANPLPETVELHHTIQAGRVTVDLVEMRYATQGGPPADEPKRSIRTLDVGDAVEQAPQIVVSQEREQEAPATPVEAPVPAISEATASKIVLPAGGVPPNALSRTQLVGRAVEMQRLSTQASSGRRRVLFVSGEPGIGKTRLAHELSNWWREEQHGSVLWGYCYEMGGSLPYQPIADAIGAHLRSLAAEELRQVLGNDAVDLAKIVPEIRAKLPDLPQPEPLGPEMERRNLYNAVAHYLATQTSNATGPLMVVLDDLQWADAATMQLLGFLTSQSVRLGLAEGVRLPLLVLLYRADEVHETHPLREMLAALLRTGDAEEVRLRRLSELEVQQLLVNLVGHDVSSIFASEIYRYTEGNPFFVGEAVRELVEEGKLKRVGERWQMMVSVNQIALPQSLRLLIERRLIRLSPESRATLAIAAVLGRQFDSLLLAQAHRLSEDVVAQHIDDAIQAQILAPIAAVAGTGGGQGSNWQDGDLAFTHDKIREVLYQGLNPLRRRALHRQVAQAIEARYAARLQPHYASLAYHYRAAEETQRAADYFARAAQHAAGVYAFVDATGYIGQALELLIGDEERVRRAELLRQLADVSLYVGRPDQAIEAGLTACDLWRVLNDPVKEAEARLDVAFAFHWMGRESEAMQHIQRALECLEAKPDALRLRAKAYAQWGLAATNMGDITVALTQLGRADELQAQAGSEDPFITVVTLWSRSWCAFLAASPLQMLAYAERSAEVCRTWHLYGWEPMMTYTLAWAQMILGRIKESEETARATLETAMRHNAVGAQGWAYLVLAFLAVQTARWERAANYASQADGIAVMLHDVDLRARVLWSRSVCAGWRSDWAEAIQAIDEALQTARQVDEAFMMQPYLLLQAAKAHFYAGKLEQADLYLEQAMRLGQERQYRQLPALGMRLLGRILVAQGKFEAAIPCFEQSLADLAALDDALEHTRTLEAYGLFYLARSRPGDSTRGKELLDTARATFKRLGVMG